MTTNISPALRRRLNTVTKTTGLELNDLINIGLSRVLAEFNASGRVTVRKPSDLDEHFRPTEIPVPLHHRLETAIEEKEIPGMNPDALSWTLLDCALDQLESGALQLVRPGQS